MTSETLIFTMYSPDQPGIVYAVTGLLASVGGNILESQQYNDAATDRFFIRIKANVPGGRSTIEAAFAQLAANFQMNFTISEAPRPTRTLIMASKEAHCLSDLLTKQHDGRLPIEIAGVVSNHEILRPLADFYKADYFHIPITKETKAAAEEKLLEIIDERKVELVVLARYMQIISPELCEKLAGSIINIHHSFLPSFKGARPYAQAHARGVKLIGATAHYVTSDLDEGPIIEQDVVRVYHDDTPADLAVKGAEVERQVLSRAVRWHAEHRILLNGTRTVIFN